MPNTPEEHRRVEAARDDEILFLLFSSPYPWTVEELARELNDSDAADGVARLAAAGLVHGLDRFVFPTRSARRVRELREQS